MLLITSITDLYSFHRKNNDWLRRKWSKTEFNWYRNIQEEHIYRAKTITITNLWRSGTERKFRTVELGFLQTDWKLQDSHFSQCGLSSQYKDPWYEESTQAVRIPSTMRSWRSASNERDRHKSKRKEIFTPQREKKLVIICPESSENLKKKKKTCGRKRFHLI